MVGEEVPQCSVQYAEGGGPDPRSYRVDCGKIGRVLPDFRPQWTVRRGISQLHEAYRDAGLTREAFLGDRYLRLKHLRKLLSQGRLGEDLRWRGSAGVLG